MCPIQRHQGSTAGSPLIPAARPNAKSSKCSESSAPSTSCNYALPFSLQPDTQTAIDVLGTQYIADKMGINRRTVQRWRAGVGTPTREHLNLLKEVIKEG